MTNMAKNKEDEERIDQFKNDIRFRRKIEHVETIPSKEANYKIRTANSNFEASVSHYGAGVYEYDRLDQKFKLFSPSYDDEFHIDCNSSMILEAFKNNEDELFKRIYIPISECPTWCQDALRERRRQQILEEDKKAQEEMLREERRQRRKELKEKFLPFLKKKK